MSSFIQQLYNGAGMDSYKPPSPDEQVLGSPVALFTTLFALPEWFKFMVLAGAFEMAKPYLSLLYRYLLAKFFLLAIFKETDTSYAHIMLWLSQQPAWSTIRTMEVSLKKSQYVNPRMPHFGPDEGPSGQSLGAYSFGPADGHVYYLKYKKRRVTLALVKSESLYGPIFYLHMRIMAFNKSILYQLLEEAKQAYIASQSSHVSIHAWDNRYESWLPVATKPKRSMTSIILEPGIKDLLLADANDFLKSRSWYAERGLGYRRGYLLYGSPGSGKTSIIHALAGELHLNVYVVSLSQSGLDDAKLGHITSQLPERCIALMEDIDVALGSNKRDLPDETLSVPITPAGAAVAVQDTNTTLSRVTLSGLLNVLDGLAAQEGRILFATTNSYTSLDPALCRAGRLDLHVEFKLASKQQAKELYRQFYDPAGMLTAQDANTLHSLPDLIDLSQQTSKSESRSLAFDEKLPNESEKDEASLAHLSALVGHTLSVKLTHSELEALANGFQNAIPERELSMASLQGFLLTYKTRPVQAVQDVVDWVKKEKEAIRKQRGISVTP